MYLKMFAPSRMGARTRLTIGAAALVASLATASCAQAAPTFLAPQSISPTTDAEDSFTGIKSASDAAGNGLIAYSLTDYAPDFLSWVQRVRYVTRNAGGSFSSQQTPSTPGVDSTGIDVAMNKSGAAVVAWMERGASAEWIVRAMAKPAGGSFGAPQDVSSSGQNATNPSVTLSDNGAAVVAWARYNGAHLIAQAAVKSSGSNSFSGASDLSSTTLDAGDVDSAIDPEGNATVAWEIVDGPTHRIQARTKPSSGGFGAVQTLTPNGDGWAFGPRWP